MILHADADAFFASVELRDRPELRPRPMAVATHIVLSANYPARAFGVRGAMRIKQARQLCPDLVEVPPRDEGYAAASESLMALFGRFARRVEPGSMEEAFLDVAPRDPLATARAVRAAAWDELGLPVTVGVGRTRLIAKLASRQAKPEGLLMVDAAAEAEMRATLSIAETWGVGPPTEAKLAAAGITMISDLAGHDEHSLKAIVSTASARRLIAIRDGTDDAGVHLLGPRRTLGASRSMVPASSDPAEQFEHLRFVGESALGRLGESEGLVRRVTVTARLFDHSLVTEQSNLAQATRDRAELIELIRLLYRLTGVADERRTVTLIGVSFDLAGVAASREQDPLPLA